jgi:hypothetical protein
MDMNDKMTVYMLRALAPSYNAILRSIDLTGCSMFILRVCNCFVYCPAGIGDESLAAIAHSCPLIEKLVFWNCKEV